MQLLNLEGIFRCVAHKPDGGWLGQSVNTGSDYIAIVCEVTEDGPQQGCEIMAYVYLTDKAFDRALKTLSEAFGFDGNFVDLDLGKTTFEGLECSITTEFETYDGKQRLKVKWLNSVNRAPKLDPKQAQDIASRLTRRAQAVMKGSNPRTPAPASPPAEGDDVPF